MGPPGPLVSKYIGDEGEKAPGPPFKDISVPLGEVLQALGDLEGGSLALKLWSMG